MSQDSIQPIVYAGQMLSDALLVRFKRKNAPRPLITVMPKGTAAVTGWVKNHAWENLDGKPITELNLCAEYVGNGLLAMGSLIAHLLVHYVNALDGVKDVKHDYHNKHFKRRCDSIGLICEKHPQKRYGWAATSLSDELKALVLSLGIDESQLGLYRLAEDVAPFGSEPKSLAAHPRRTARVAKSTPQKLKRWTCSCSKVWAGKLVSVRCNWCGQVFEQRAPGQTASNFDF